MPLEATGLVLTFNGERHLRKTLASLSWCSRLLVVDSQSTDATLRIAEQAGAEVLVRAWEGPGPQFAFAFDQVRTEWVVSLDQDEYLSKGLLEKLTALNSPPEDLAGYRLCRRSWYFDRFLRHSGWYPDRLLRVFRPSRIRVLVSPPHYGFHPLGRTMDIDGDIIHFPYHDLSEHLTKINAYSRIGAEALIASGRRCGVASALGHGTAKFLRIYLLRRGFLDGRAGFVLAVHGFMATLLKYLRVAERSIVRPPDPEEPIRD